MADALYSLPNVPIFSTGTWNGDVYAESDLDAMCAAYGKVGFQPPIKLGHDETQLLAKNDGMPALGHVANLRRVGGQLYADLVNLPRRVLDAIKRKAYNRVSAEIYWGYKDQGKEYPRVLKALALLGADIPAVTSLASLESLYQIAGPFRAYALPAQPFKIYDYDEPMMVQGAPAQAAGQTPPITGGWYGAPKLPKAGVNYRHQDDGAVTAPRCGTCKFFTGMPDPTGDNAGVAACSIVEGEVASAWVCDQHAARDAFVTFTEPDVNAGVLRRLAATDAASRTPVKRHQFGAVPVVEGGAARIEEQAGRFCVVTGTKTLQCFDTPDEAEAYVRSLEELGQAGDIPARDPNKPAPGDLPGSDTGGELDENGELLEEPDEGAQELDRILDEAVGSLLGELAEETLARIKERIVGAFGTASEDEEGESLEDGDGDGAGSSDGMMAGKKTAPAKPEAAGVPAKPAASGAPPAEKFPPEPATKNQPATGTEPAKKKLPPWLRHALADADFVKSYVVQRRGSGFVLVSRKTGRVLGKHPSRAAALRQERAIEISKHANAEVAMTPDEMRDQMAGMKAKMAAMTDGPAKDKLQQDMAALQVKMDAAGMKAMSVRTFALSRDQVAVLCPFCAERMAYLNLRELKMSYDPETKTYAGFSQGMCDKFGEAAGFRTRCMPQMKGNVDDEAAFCNALKAYCFGDVSAGEKKASTDQAARQAADAPGAGPARDGQPGGREIDVTEKEYADKVAQLETEKQQAEARAAKAEQEAKTYAEQAAVASEQQRQGEIDKALDQLSGGSEPKLLPVEKPYARHLLNVLTAPAGTVVKSYAHEGKELGPADVFRKMLEARPSVKAFAEVSQGGSTREDGRPGLAGPGDEAPRATAARKAREYQQEQREKGIAVDYVKAFKHVLANDQELAAACDTSTNVGQAKAEQSVSYFARMSGQTRR